MTQVVEHVEDLKDRYKKLSDFEALQIATKVAEIEAYRQAHVIDWETSPSALEAIATCLGQGGQFSSTITDALNSVAESMGHVATAIEKKK
ncbi:hypothetical protein LC612_43970 [Nostoc sp. CHAB 5834]|nr:hypothetical protein [Nostoc sp. CHAB 5834]